jgi:hypothetical protein
LPEIILADEFHWMRFLEEGYLDGNFGGCAGWKYEMLSDEQLRNLYRFLVREYGSPEQAPGMSLFCILRSRFDGQVP